jgi:peptidylprolyl isomerase
MRKENLYTGFVGQFSSIDFIQFQNYHIQAFIDTIDRRSTHIKVTMLPKTIINRYNSTLPTHKVTTNTGPASRLLCSSSLNPDQPKESVIISRRQLELATVTALILSASASPSHALGFKKELKKRKIPEEEYTPLDNGLKYYDLSQGTGQEIKPGTQLKVHFDCLYKGIDVVSSRSARLLGGNRTIAEPFEFVAGESISASSIKKINDSANGLFSGQGGPRPPPALSTGVLGMKVGGKRSVLVPPELGFGAKGEQEIGPNTPFELQIEVLSVA